MCLLLCCCIPQGSYFTWLCMPKWKERVYCFDQEEIKMVWSFWSVGWLLVLLLLVWVWLFFLLLPFLRLNISYMRLWLWNFTLLLSVSCPSFCTVSNSKIFGKQMVQSLWSSRKRTGWQLYWCCQSLFSLEARSVLLLQNCFLAFASALSETLAFTSSEEEDIFFSGDVSKVQLKENA